MRFYLLILVCTFLSCHPYRGIQQLPWELGHLKKLNNEVVYIPEYLSLGCSNISNYDGIIPEMAPHDGQAVNYYTNSITADFMNKNKWPFQFPEGSIIVKEKLFSDNNEYGAMFKREKGYDSAN